MDAALNPSPAVDLHAQLLAMLAAPQPVIAPVAPLVCGDARIGGGHLWTRELPFTWSRTLVCSCGARAREGYEGDVFAEFGFGPSPAPRGMEVR